MKRNLLLVGSLGSAVLASLCCIGPVLVAVTGVGTLAAAGALETWRPYLLALTGLLLAGGLLLVYRQSRAACAPGSSCSATPMSRASVGLIALLVTGVVAVSAFPYYSGPVVEARSRNAVQGKADGATALKTVTFSVSGMTCASCARGLEASFRNLAGVKEAKVDYDAKRATISYDPAKQSEQALRKLVTDAGYSIEKQ
jgi:mercuric ion transport protein